MNGSDMARIERNRAAGHTLCGHCGGSGNQLYSMYQRCENCGGSGVAVYRGELSRFGRWWVERREAREARRLAKQCRAPRDWSATFRTLASRWFGVGNWFQDGRDRCWRCGAEPSDIDYAMRRVKPFRAECLDTEGCESVIAEASDHE